MEGVRAAATHGLLYINPLPRLLEFVTGIMAYSVFAWLRPRMAALHEASPGITIVAATIAGAFALVYTSKLCGGFASGVRMCSTNPTFLQCDLASFDDRLPRPFEFERKVGLA